MSSLDSDMLFTGIMNRFMVTFNDILIIKIILIFIYLEFEF